MISLIRRPPFHWRLHISCPSVRTSLPPAGRTSWKRKDWKSEKNQFHRFWHKTHHHDHDHNLLSVKGEALNQFAGSDHIGRPHVRFQEGLTHLSFLFILISFMIFVYFDEQSYRPSSCPSSRGPDTAILLPKELCPLSIMIIIIIIVIFTNDIMAIYVPSW